MADGRYELPEGVAATNPRPIRDFFVQGGIAVTLLIALIYGLFQLGLFLGPLIPFSWEKQVSELALGEFPLTTDSAEARARRDTIQRLVDDLVPHMDLPEGVEIIVHYSDTSDVNAFATLGGNIVIFEGLIERLPSENALSMVIAHEIGHVKRRDPIRHMSGDRLVTLVVSLATGDSGLAAEIVNNIQLLTSLRFSRETEETADREGLGALYGRYGHVNGYQQTFDALDDWIADNGGDALEPPEFLRTHPDTATRKAELAAYAARMGWPTEGELTPLRQANFPPEEYLPEPSHGAANTPKVQPDEAEEPAEPSEEPTAEPDEGPPSHVPEPSEPAPGPVSRSPNTPLELEPGSVKPPASSEPDNWGIIN